MNILVLEDRGDVSYFLNEHLGKKGHTVFLAQNVSRAKTFWKNKDIDCIIADLNMPHIGLTATEQEQTEHGLFTGWVWLKNYVFPEDHTIIRRTIILSSFMKEFKARLKKEGVKPNEIGIRMVSKRSPPSIMIEDMESVLKHVKEIADQFVS